MKIISLNVRGLGGVKKGGLFGSVFPIQSDNIDSLGNKERMHVRSAGDKRGGE